MIESEFQRQNELTERKFFFIKKRRLLFVSAVAI
jgi:hypothetical protein